MLKKFANIFKSNSRWIRAKFVNKYFTSYNGYKFILAIDSSLSLFRAETYFTKEPDTIEWINAFSKDDVFWDVGANLGLYSLYAAKVIGCDCVAFEAAVHNSKLMVDNFLLNNVGEMITIVPIPLSHRSGAEVLFMSDIVSGSAHCSFSRNIDQCGKEHVDPKRLKVLGLSGADVMSHLGLPPPTKIKIDVDGAEHLVLIGLRSILSTVNQILIEVNESFSEQWNETFKILGQAGFREKSRSYSGFDKQFNIIFERR